MSQQTGRGDRAHHHDGVRAAQPRCHRWGAVGPWATARLRALRPRPFARRCIQRHLSTMEALLTSPSADVIKETIGLIGVLTQARREP